MPRLASIGGGGVRAGLELTRGSGSVGAAVFRSTLDLVAPFGLAFDRGILPADSEARSGGELYATVPLTAGLTVGGWYTRIQDALERPYTPVDLGRAFVRLRGSFYGDQLEPALMVEGIHRGRATVPGAEGLAFDATAASYRQVDLSFRLRIIDVEAYLMWNNLSGNRAAIDFPDAPPALPRIVYGASWRFRN